MKVLVTGAQGFVGSNLVWSLRNIADGFDRREWVQPLRPLEVLEATRSTTPQELASMCAEADFVVHLAGCSRPKQPAEFMAVNRDLTAELLDYLEQAAFRADQMLTLFADDERGGFYRTASDAETLISRPKELFDGAMPSGNSCAAMVLQKLAELTGEKRFLDAAFAQHAFVAGQAERYGSGVAYGLLAMMRSLFPHRELICCGETDGGALQTYLKQHPANALAILWKTKENALQLDKLAPFTSAYGVPEQGMQWYLCTNGTCDLPVSSFDALRLS